jgi:hypothetical protein
MLSHFPSDGTSVAEGYLVILSLRVRILSLYPVLFEGGQYNQVRRCQQTVADYFQHLLGITHPPCQ